MIEPQESGQMGCGSLYIHVPFCLGKCPYCDFYSVVFQEELAQVYTDAMCRAIYRIDAKQGPFNTIYFGGGTPSLLGGKQIGRILEAAARLGIGADAEITVECNPGTVTDEGFFSLRTAGVNRLSLGVQSADNRLLKTLGRRHDAQQAAAAANMARKAGFEHLSFDLMLALPEQTEEDVIRSIRFCRSQGAEHVSAYLLKIEPGTPFFQMGIGNQCPNEDAQADFYLLAVRALEAYGFHQYEISNFAREGKIAKHNWNYWDCGEYLGLGPSAHSFMEGRRFFFPRDLSAFLNAENPLLLCEDDGPGGTFEEYVMLRLRLTQGIVWDALEKRYSDGKQRKKLSDGAGILAGTGLLEMDAQGLRLTTQGMLVSNSVIATLLPDGDV